MNLSSFGICGLGVMGQNLALNLEEKGISLSVFNRNAEGESHLLPEFMSSFGKDREMYGTDNLADFMASLERPRKILMMVKAGEAVDQVIDQMRPFLEPGDILIDGGNSHFKDSQRRTGKLASEGVLFTGMGVSGGEEGARKGPSLMPGGNKEAWSILQPILEPVAARSYSNTPCCGWIGNGGAGHFVKMIHNGIEYADMQLISEAYHLMKNVAGLSPMEMTGLMDEWNRGALNSYLLEITSHILRFKDTDGEPLLDKILDRAGQKGTGAWTAVTALEEGLPLPAITEAVFSRYISSQKKLREQLSDISVREARTTDSKQPPNISPEKRKQLLDQLPGALLAARMMCYSEGFFAIRQASDTYQWDIQPSLIARIWQGGCIIRSKLLSLIENVGESSPMLPHLLLAPEYQNPILQHTSEWKGVISLAIQQDIPVPVFTSTLQEFQALSTRNLPANLIQAQRDYFGAHTYERTDRPAGEYFHTRWK
ncbi:decarboxylating NADP(+)-dependent phosphogluconate dehydrogenase [Balneolaceae bacterium ANBcel3]|nr:decarboxylating NADP(+)-dependent phosphogluconate dehydrogenase [Balneolaceae bacterium ANBcel3]